MTEDQIKHMRDRFLGWKLPADFSPDCGIHFDADAAKKANPQNHRYEPSGTNLFDARQADAMVRHMVEGMPGALDDKAVEIALLRGALAKIVRLEESEGADPLDDAVRLARNALLTA